MSLPQFGQDGLYFGNSKEGGVPPGTDEAKEAIERVKLAMQNRSNRAPAINLSKVYLKICNDCGKNFRSYFEHDNLCKECR